MWDVPARWDVTRGSQRGVARVEVWSNGVQVAEVDPTDPLSGVLTCSVTERYVTGLQRSLSMTVEPSYEWLTHAKRPGLEIRPYSGFNWGTSEYLVPLGRFPILPPAISLPASAVSFDADDYWSWLVRAKHPVMARVPGLIRTFAASRFRVAGLPDPLVLATSDAVVPGGAGGPVRVAGSESDLVSQLVASIAATAYFDRDGQPVIEDRHVTTGDVLRDGENGTVIQVSSTRDWAGVINRYRVYSSNNDLDLAPQRASIDDPDHPAYFANGLGWVDAEYSSALFTSQAQMRATARMLVDRDSRAARSWTVTAIPDPARMPGDRITVITGLGSTVVIIQEITHHLTGEAMTMTLGAS